MLAQVTIIAAIALRAQAGHIQALTLPPPPHTIGAYAILPEPVALSQPHDFVRQKPPSGPICNTDRATLYSTNSNRTYG